MDAILYWLLFLAWFVLIVYVYDYMLKKEKAKIGAMRAELAKKIQETKEVWKLKYGDAIAESLANGIVKVGMTEDMVLEAWGRPTQIDQSRETQKYKQHRFVYGTPRRGHGANYVIIRDGLVSDVTTNFRPLVVDNLAYKIVNEQNSARLIRWSVTVVLSLPLVIALCCSSSSWLFS